MRTCFLILAAITIRFADAQGWPKHEFGGTVFDSFVQESFKATDKGKAASFYAFMEKGIKANQSASWTAWINLKQGELSASKDKPATRGAITAELHGIIKKVIPKFNLDRGFEFAYTTSLGERQCFLQSVLIASILQRVGIEAGTVMVYRNAKGETSNLGHACNLVRFDETRSALVDASDPTPFNMHQGIFLRINGRYKFTKPQYEGSHIKLFWPAGGGPSAPLASVLPLPVDYLNSMFDYYRGERVAGGLMTQKPTQRALTKTTTFLERSVRRSPQNPPAVIQLARTYLKQGRIGQAELRIQHAERLYKAAGWMPGSVTELRDQIKALKSQE